MRSVSARSMGLAQNALRSSLLLTTNTPIRAIAVVTLRRNQVSPEIRPLERFVYWTRLAGSLPVGGGGGTINPRPCRSRTVRCAGPRQTSWQPSPWQF
jgi:hypothetical protein